MATTKENQNKQYVTLKQLLDKHGFAAKLEYYSFKLITSSEVTTFKGCNVIRIYFRRLLQLLVVLELQQAQN